MPQNEEETNMGCDSMHGWTPGDSALSAVERLKGELDTVTAILCEVLKAVEPKKLSPAALCWAQEHAEHDRKAGRPTPGSPTLP